MHNYNYFVLYNVEKYLYKYIIYNIEYIINIKYVCILD